MMIYIHIKITNEKLIQSKAGVGNIRHVCYTWYAKQFPVLSEEFDKLRFSLSNSSVKQSQDLLYNDIRITFMDPYFHTLISLTFNN